MRDFRMNKNKPLGSKNLTTIAGFSQKRESEPEPTPEPVPVPEPIIEKVEVVEYVDARPVAEQLGSLIKPVDDKLPEESKELPPPMTEDEIDKAVEEAKATPKLSTKKKKKSKGDGVKKAGIEAKLGEETTVTIGEDKEDDSENEESK